MLQQFLKGDKRLAEVGNMKEMLLVGLLFYEGPGCKGVNQQFH